MASERETDGILAAARYFAETWAELIESLPDSYDCHMTCEEAEAAADLYRALGWGGTADALLTAHAAYDDGEDPDHGVPAATYLDEVPGD